MPNQPTLNPDALESACAGFYNDPMWLTMWERLCTADPALAEKYRAGMKVAVSAYLAVAQPVVHSVEELDALPYGSLITGTSGVTVMKYDGPNYDWITGNDYRYRMEEQEQCLPARVLYRPEVKP